jgi:hypothetical protein
MMRRLFLIASVVLLATATAQAERFTVQDIGTTSVPVRIMKKTGAVQTYLYDAGVSSGTGSYTANTKTVKDPSGSGATAKFVTPVIGAAGGTSTLSVSFGKVGIANGTFDVGSSTKKLLLLPADKQTTPAGAMMNYHVNVLEQRKLKVEKGTLKLGNVLAGAKIDTSYNVMTKNAAAISATNVTIGSATFADANNAKNQLTTATTFVGGSASSTALKLTGYLTDYSLKAKSKGAVGVVTAENASVGDNVKTYKDLKLSYTANVGIANKITKAPAGVTDFAKSTVLSANVAAGDRAAYYNAETGTKEYFLKSKVAKNESTALGLASESTTAISQVTSLKNYKKSGLKNLYGIVGSEAEIVSSTAVANGGSISMAWRARTNSENYNWKFGPTVLPGGKEIGSNWLTSDVVKIEGLAANTTYALQMTFDNRINLAFDGSVATVANTYNTLFVGTMDGTSGKWGRTANATAEKGNFLSLEDFLKANADKDLSTLEGAWGVDPNSKDAGTGHSWVIVNGTGSTAYFAVVPEPATVVMMLSAVLGAVAYGWRRFSRRKQLA